MNKKAYSYSMMCMTMRMYCYTQMPDLIGF